MNRFLLLAAGLIVTLPVFAADDAKVDAAFVGEGTYSPTTGCKKLEAIQNGQATPNIATYPLTLTREGTGSWEGGCGFRSIREVKPDTFEGKMDCSEGAEEYQETVRFRRLDANRIEVASGTESLTYERCTALKGPVGR